MRTIEISNAKARTLAEFLAPQWARLAVHIVAANVDVSSPVRLCGEGREAAAFKRRVARMKDELAAIGDVLVGLGATLPKANRDAVVRPYTSPRNPRRKYSMYSSGGGTIERTRLVAAILASLDGIEA